MRRGWRLQGYSQTDRVIVLREQARSHRCLHFNVGASLLAKGPYQATPIRRPNTMVQRSDKTTPPKVSNPPTR